MDDNQEFTYKYKEQALLLLMLSKQEEFLSDNSKTFKEGIMFGYLSEHLIMYWRCLLAQEAKISPLSRYDQELITRCDGFCKELGITFIDIEFMRNNYLDILKQYEGETR